MAPQTSGNPLTQAQAEAAVNKAWADLDQANVALEQAQADVHRAWAALEQAVAAIDPGWATYYGGKEHGR